MNTFRYSLRQAAAILILAIGVLWAPVSSAELLGLAPGLPLLNYDSGGSVTYNASNGAFSVRAKPISMLFPPPRPVGDSDGNGPGVVHMDFNLTVDPATGLPTGVSGVPANDLLVVGKVDTTGDGNFDANGILLTGEVVAFGFQDSGPGGTTDNYDLRFRVTGGALAPFYGDNDIAVTLSSENSSFANDFRVDFDGNAKGNVGPTPKVSIVLLKEVSVDGGVTYFDANDGASAPVTGVGGDALYRLTVTNDGSVDLTNVVIDDVSLGIANFLVGDLAAGQTVVLGEGEIPQLEQPGRCQDPGDVVNIAIVEGDSVSDGTTVTDDDPAVVRCLEESIKILKEVSVDGGANFFDANDGASAPVAELGGDVLYRITVMNDGTSDLENVVINDAQLNIVNFAIGNLAVGQTVVLTQVEIPQLEQPGRCQVPGDVVNTASVEGTSVDSGNPVSDSDPAFVRCVKEEISLLKEVSVDGGVTFFDANDSGSAPATAVGGGAIYRLTVTNEGTSVLTNVVINDADLGIVNFAVGDLAPGQTVVLTEVEIPALEKPGRCADPGDVTNTATVDAVSVDTGNPVADEDPAVVRCVKEDIILLKEVSVDGGITFFDANDGATAPVAALGDNALYRITVTNNGSSPLQNVVVNDLDLGIVNHPVGDLDPGQSVVLTEVEIPQLEQPGRCQDPGEVTNIATTSGTSVPTGNTVSDSDPAVVNCAPPPPQCEIKVVKTVEPDTIVCEGDPDDGDKDKDKDGDTAKDKDKDKDGDSSHVASVADRFDTSSFGNNDGNMNWSGDWIEVDGDGAGPGSGNVRISYGKLKLDDRPNTGGQPSLAREADLSGLTEAVLLFDFQTTSGVDPDDSVVVEISSDGGATYTELENFTGISGATSGSRDYDITAFISTSTRIRFRVANLYGGSDEKFKVDYVAIAARDMGHDADKDKDDDTSKDKDKDDDVPVPGECRAPSDGDKDKDKDGDTAKDKDSDSSKDNDTAKDKDTDTAKDKDKDADGGDPPGDPPACPPEQVVTYTYVVSNLGGALENILLTDDKVELNEPPFSLPVGGSKEVTRDVCITETTTNKATATGTLVSTGEQCMAMDTATVSVEVVPGDGDKDKDKDTDTAKDKDKDKDSDSGDHSDDGSSSGSWWSLW